MMGRQRGFLPPPICQVCGKPPDLGQSLWPGEQWRCTVCLEAHLPGKDTVSKSIAKTLEYANEIKEAFELEAEGSNAEGPRNRAEWARMMAAAIRKEGLARVKEVARGKGEVISPGSGKWLHDTLSVPSLASVEASLARSRLLLENVTDVAAMALDAADSIGATNSLEKMLAHQLAAVHKVIMEQMGIRSSEYGAMAQAKRLNAATRGMSAYQQGLLTLHKIRQNGQRIVVQYVHVGGGGKAIIGNIERSGP